MLDLSMMRGQPSRLSSESNLTWINQEKPPAAAWVQWRKACRMWCGTDGTLISPLGKWLLPYKQLRRNWKTLYHVRTRRLFVTINSETQVFSKLDDTFHIQPWRQRIPSASRPVTICDTNTGWKIQAPVCRQYHVPISLPPASFLDFLQSQPNTSDSALFHTVDFLQSPFLIAHILVADKFLGVSDGSVRYNKEGAFGWIISLSDGTRLVRCSGPVYGAKPSSYRAECYGMLSLVRFLQLLSEYCGINDLKICNLSSDNLSMLNNINGYTYADLESPNSTLIADWDVLSELFHCLYISTPNFQPTFTHVKGHQDRDKAYDELSLVAQLNVDADEAADIFQNQHGAERPFVPCFSHNRAQLHLPTGTVTTNIKKPDSICRYSTKTERIHVYPSQVVRVDSGKH